MQERELVTDEPSSATRFRGPSLSSPWGHIKEIELLQSSRQGQTPWFL